MDFHTEIRKVLAQLSGHDRIVTIPKTYIEITGNLAESILLNQIVFYSDKSKRKDGFFYKSYKEWEEETCLTERQVRYATKKLKDKGLIETKLLKANGSPTVHYKLHSDKLVKWIMTNCENGSLQNVSNVPNILSETLTEDVSYDSTEDKESIVHQDELFEEWWNFYGNKKGKVNCLAKYKRLLKKYQHELIMAGTEKYMLHRKQLLARGEFLPQQKNPLTFLNGENFNDEYETPRHDGASAIQGTPRKEFSLDIGKGEDE
ncbi:hypothetical protein [Sporosarcina sp. FSL K6-5500]|uniref:hypothetical protein n=1 Tax=Sporosarcina sp. FSL K6-5500 TaxID=2921558 RepID=UPI0030FAF88C